MITDSMKSHLVESAEEVFQTMVPTPIITGEVLDGAEVHETADIAATVGVIGPSSALVTCYSTRPVARTLTAAILGVDESEIQSESADAMGEFANMIAGSFRNRMSGEGGNWAITIPSVVTGQNLTMRYGVGMRRVLCPFTLGSGTFFVELVLNSD